LCCASIGIAVALIDGMRDLNKIETFKEADDLLIAVYRLSAGFPAEERYGLRAQLREAALSAPTNIAEGSARFSTREYCRFLEIAHGSARESWYLLTVSKRLEYLKPEDDLVIERYDGLQRGLLAQIRSLQRRGDGDRPDKRRQE
jgi:four helix bundle protein